MPLSEQEQRLLDEMERNLYHGDADFVASVGRVPGRVNYTAVAGGVLLAIAGIGGLILGVLLQNWFVGVLGFAAMFAGVLLAIGSPGRRRVATGAFSAAPRARRSGFMDRMNDRWERRRRG